MKHQLGTRLKTLRKARQLTLVELSGVSGVSTSTISKIENGALSPTLDKIILLSEGLGISIVELIGEETGQAGESTPPNGRFSPARKGDGVLIETPNYDYLYLCQDLKKKQMVPILARVKSHDIQSFGDLIQHDGEEFLFVLEGEIEVHTEFYAPLSLSKGEGVYLDSTMGHGYLKTNAKDAEVICICTQPDMPV